MGKNFNFLTESPIKDSKQDLFNFKHFAEKVKYLIQNNSANSEAFTIGIYGKWGEGKTSFLNLIRENIEHFDKEKNQKEYLIYEFNPWRYSSEDEMIFDFFDGLCKRFYIEKEKNIQKAGKFIEKYSKYLSFIKITAGTNYKKIEILPDKFFEALGKDLKGKEITIEKLKDKVNSAIKESKFKVVVIIDDLDRLDKNEIYTILKLIKLNANFDNFIFITTLDSEQIAKAIKDRYGSDINDGYSFLEKIINIPIQLPRIEKEDLQYFFELNFGKILNNLSFISTEEKSQLIRDISSELSISLFKTPREIIRLLNSFFTTAFTIGEEINLEDLFWLEFIKIRNEQCYNFLKNYEQNELFKYSNTIIDFKSPFIEDNYEERDWILKEFENVKNIIEKLFPVEKNNSFFRIDPVFNNKNLKINSAEHYDKYFSLHTQRKVSNGKFKEIEKLITQQNLKELTKALQDLFEGQRINKSISRIENLITLVDKEEDRNFLFEAVFSNIKYLPKSDEGFLDYKIRLIEKIAKILNSDFDKKGNQRDNSIISIKLSKVLELNELCFFVRKFGDFHLFKNEMSKILVEKSKTFISENSKFYHDPLNSPNKSIFYYLSKIDKEFLENFLEEKIENIDDVKFLIRNFSPFWNNSFFGGIDKETYDYIKEILNVDILFGKIQIFQSEIIDKIDSSLVIDKLADTSLDENLEQFIYWYKLENPNK